MPVEPPACELITPDQSTQSVIAVISITILLAKNKKGGGEGGGLMNFLPLKGGGGGYLRRGWGLIEYLQNKSVWNGPAWKHK